MSEESVVQGFAEETTEQGQTESTEAGEVNDQPEAAAEETGNQEAPAGDAATQTDNVSDGSDPYSIVPDDGDDTGDGESQDGPESTLFDEYEAMSKELDNEVRIVANTDAEGNAVHSIREP